MVRRPAVEGHQVRMRSFNTWPFDKSRVPEMVFSARPRRIEPQKPGAHSDKPEHADDEGLFREWRRGVFRRRKCSFFVCKNRDSNQYTRGMNKKDIRRPSSLTFLGRHRAFVRHASICCQAHRVGRIRSSI